MKWSKYGMVSTHMLHIVILFQLKAFFFQSNKDNCLGHETRFKFEGLSKSFRLTVIQDTKHLHLFHSD